MRRLLYLLSFLLVASSTAVAYADTVSYTFSANPNSDSAGSVSGFGTFSYETDPTQIGTGLQAYDLTSLSLKLGGGTFTLGTETDAINDPARAVFQDGVFVGINYDGSACVSKTKGGFCTDSASLSAGPKGNNFTFTPGATSPDGNLTTGTFSGSPIVPGATITPEPSSFVLLGTGALGLIGAARRRFVRG